MAWAIGAGSSGSTPFAPAVGANAIGVLRSALLVGILGFAGAVLQGGRVTEAVGRELIHGVELTVLAAAIGLLAAAALVAVGVFIGIPIATAFTVTGAMIGAGLALGGSPAWSKYAEIGGLWLATPFVGGTMAYGTARMLRRESVSERRVVPVLAGLLGGVLAHLRFDALSPGQERGSVARWTAAHTSWDPILASVLATVALGLLTAGIVRWRMAEDKRAGERWFVLALGALVAFSAGASQVGLAAGPMLPVVEGSAIGIQHLLAVAGVAILAGSWMGAPRMIKAVAHDYGSLGPRRSIAALVPSFLIAQAAVFLGVPISFNEIVISGVVGSGLAAGSDAISGTKIRRTIGAWVLSLTVSTVLVYAAVRLIVLV